MSASRSWQLFGPQPSTGRLADGDDTDRHHDTRPPGLPVSPSMLWRACNKPDRIEHPTESNFMIPMKIIEDPHMETWWNFCVVLRQRIEYQSETQCIPLLGQKKTHREEIHLHQQLQTSKSKHHYNYLNSNNNNEHQKISPAAAAAATTTAAPPQQQQQQQECP